MPDRAQSCYFSIFLRSAQRFFIASDSRFRPAGVRPPRFLPTDVNAEPKSAPMTRLSLTRSLFKSETTFARSKVRSLLFPESTISISLQDTILANELTRYLHLDGSSPIRSAEPLVSQIEA